MKRPKIVTMSILSTISILILSGTKAMGQNLDWRKALNLRGQALASLCYDFSEEQLLKDLVCKENCQNNANKWKFSIFDIAKVHQQDWLIDRPNSIKGSLDVDLLTNGASNVFPFKRTQVTSVRSSQCTLEAELFFLNRSIETNPDRQDFVTYFESRFQSFKDKTIQDPPIPYPNIAAAWNELKRLASQSNSAPDFLHQIISYTKCGEKIDIPQFVIRTESPIEPSQIEQLIRVGLTEAKSLYVGVCAEVIRDEVSDSSPCGRHAIVIKDIRKSDCAVGVCEDEIKVIDSAFFSKRTLNQDGSAWIPLHVVVSAVEKSALDFKSIMDKYPKQMAQLEQTAQATVVDAVKGLKDVLEKVPSNQRAAAFVAMINQLFDSLENNVSNQALHQKFLNRFSQSTFIQSSDVDTYSDIIDEALLKSIKQQMGQNLVLPQGNGIVWIK